MIHEKPHCFGCGEELSPEELIYAPVCGAGHDHVKCGSACWHAMCRMKWMDIEKDVLDLAKRTLREMGYE